MDKKDSTSKKLTKEENLFVEEVFHEIDYERGMFQPLTDEELEGLSPVMRKAIQMERDRIQRLEDNKKKEENDNEEGEENE